ncbi:MAG: DUF4180 domain-containing protein [Deltaproteobacteria bacterium]|nr:DUF4180 domain-containing protein [Deltaproteobacteria bacterium]
MCVLSESGPLLRAERDALDAMGEAYGSEYDWLAIPVARFAPECFELKTRVLGEMLQKFVNYGVRVAIVGDVGAYVAGSDSFRDFVRETNRGRQLWFAATLEDLAERLASRGAGTRS